MTDATFTPTEAEIASLIARGRTNREVAAELDISTKTVEWHLSRIYRKAGVRSRTELALRVAHNPRHPLQFTQAGKDLTEGSIE